MKSLVFLEHHGGELEKGGLGVLAKAATLGEAAGVVLGEGAAGLAAGAGAYGAANAYACEAAELAAPLPQPRVDALATLVEKTGADAVLFAASVLAADVASGLAARLDAGLNWDLMDLSFADGELVGKRPALGDTVLVDVSWKGGPQARARARGGVRSRRDGRIGRGRDIRYDLLRLLHARDARRAHAGGVEWAFDRGGRHHRRLVDAGSARRRDSR